MKALVFLLALLFLSPSILAETSKPELSLDKVVSEMNKEKENKVKYFVSVAEAKKDVDVVKALKADKNYTFINTIIHGEHILTYCIKNKMWKSAEELIKGGSNLNHKDSDGKVALMYAAEGKNKYLATMIIASKADKKIKDNAGVTAEEYLKRNGLN
ncbi:MAG: ankyrin repeat domain-containing protein [Bdellovibrionota bacterium]